MSMQLAHRAAEAPSAGWRERTLEQEPLRARISKQRWGAAITTSRPKRTTKRSSRKRSQVLPAEQSAGHRRISGPAEDNLAKVTRAERVGGQKPKSRKRMRLARRRRIRPKPRRNPVERSPRSERSHSPYFTSFTQRKPV